LNTRHKAGGEWYPSRQLGEVESTEHYEKRGPQKERKVSLGRGNSHEKVVAGGKA